MMLVDHDRFVSNGGEFRATPKKRDRLRTVKEHRDPEASRGVRFVAQGSLLAIDSKACDMEWAFEEPHQCEPQVTEQAAIVTIRGPLNHHPDVRFDSYDRIVPRIEAAFQSSAPGVLLSGDSPGGDVSGCFDTASELVRLRQKYGKPLIGYVDGQCSSAMYALICACDKIVIPREGVAGSIGVYSEMTSKVRLNAAMGLDKVMVSSGERKLDGNPNVPITDEAIANVQTGVDQQANVFWSWVSERRGLKLESVIGFQGRSFHGASAVAMGLADVVGTFTDALAMVAGDSVAKAAQSGGDTQGAAGMSALRKMLLDEAAGEDDNAKRARRALEAYDAEEEPEKKPEHEEPDGDEPEASSAEDEDDETSAEDEVEARKATKATKATKAEDEESKRAESEEEEAKGLEDEARKAEDDASDEDAKARTAMRSKAYTDADVAMARATKKRNYAKACRAKAARCLKDAALYRSMAKSNSIALAAQKAVARTATRTVATSTAPSTRGAGQGEPRTNSEAAHELPPDVAKVIGFNRSVPPTMEFEGKQHLALMTPAQATEIYNQTQAKIAKLGGRS